MYLAIALILNHLIQPASTFPTPIHTPITSTPTPIPPRKNQRRTRPTLNHQTSTTPLINPQYLADHLLSLFSLLYNYFIEIPIIEMRVQELEQIVVHGVMLCEQLKERMQMGVEWGDRLCMLFFLPRQRSNLHTTLTIFPSPSIPIAKILQIFLTSIVYLRQQIQQLRCDILAMDIIADHLE